MVITLMMVCRLVCVKDEIIIFIASRKEKCSRQGVNRHCETVWPQAWSGQPRARIRKF
jgi:hypothetical protein